jgi:ferredoxin
MKAKYHKMAPDSYGFGQIICDIHKATKIQLHIMDGILAMQGEGPTAGGIYQADKILISEDPLALDAVAAKMVGMDVEDVPILETARKRNLGEGWLKNITLAGDYEQVPRLASFKLPKRFRGAKKQNSKILVKVIDFFNTHPRINPNKCKKCNMCVESCPVQAIDKDTKRIDYNTCIDCMCCHELCMFKAVLGQRHGLRDRLEPLGVLDVHPVRSLEEGEVAEGGLAERQQLDPDPGRVGVGGHRERASR